MLDSSESFKSIARRLGRDCTTISKEIRSHMLFQKTGCLGHSFNDCANKRNCTVSNLCHSDSCTFKFCSNCPKCYLYCPDYIKQHCDRLAHAENNHEFIRRILPKGTSFDELTQEKVDLMMNHINSYCRANLGNQSPYEMFRFLYGQEILDALGAVPISPNDIILRPELLK